MRNNPRWLITWKAHRLLTSPSSNRKQKQAKDVRKGCGKRRKLMFVDNPLVPGAVIKNCQIGQCESLMHQFCKTDYIPSCYLWCFSLYYFSIFIIGIICSLFFPYFILSSIDSRLTYFVRRILLRLNSNLDVLYVNIISCTSNFLEFEACINTLWVFLSSIEEKSSISLMQSLNYFTSIEMFVLWRSRWVLILRQAKRIMLSGIRKK